MATRIVDLDVARFTAAGGASSITGKVLATPTKRLGVSGQVILPAPVPGDLGSTITLEINDADWGWNFEVRGIADGKPISATWCALVTEADPATVKLSDLAEVDRKTFNQVAPAAWTAALTALGVIVGGKQNAVDLDEDAALLVDTPGAELELSIAAKIAAAITGKQPLAAFLTDIAGLAATMTDGQRIKLDATLGHLVAVNPEGNSLNAAAMNNSGASTAFSSVAATIPGTAISVTNSNGRTVALEWEGCFIQTALGTGTAYLMVYETTGGSNTYRGGAKATLPNSIAANLANLTWDLTRLPIGVVTTTRTFELRAIILVASSAPTASVANAPTNPTILEAHNQ